nr:DUF3352 domain-containing protein [Acaryochloris sp. CCMEE 5410]
MKDKEDLEVKETDHKGVKILEIDASGSPSYVAILENHLAMSDNQDVVKKAIDSSKGDPSLASDGETRKILEESLKMEPRRSNLHPQLWEIDYPGGSV